MNIRNIHPDFSHFLEEKEPELVDLFVDLRAYILNLYPEANELLYHTHALTSAFSISEKLSDGFCLIPIYREHLNLGFTQGTLLEDPAGLLTGTGKLMRHIPVRRTVDYRNDACQALIQAAIAQAIISQKKPGKHTAETISKIKR